MSSVTSPRRKIIVTALSLALIGVAAPARAESPADVRVWTAVAAQGPFGAGSPWWWAADVFVRARDGVHTVDSAAGRVSIGRDITPTSRAAIGYAYGAGFPDAGGTRGEHRFHQQYVGTRTAAGLRLSARSRLEERFVEGGSGARLRVRQQVRVARALGTRGLQVVASEEILVNIAARGGTSRGLDGNRLFVGVRRALGPSSAIEIGYLNLYTPGRSAPGRSSHVLSTVLALTF